MAKYARFILVARREEGAGGEAGSPFSIPVPTDLPRVICLTYPNWPSRVGVSAQAPSRPWRDVESCHGTRASGRTWFSRPAALSSKRELMEGWLEGGPWSLLGGQRNLLRCPHHRDNSASRSLTSLLHPAEP